MNDAVDRHFMKRALELASRARGFTAPNPMVGAVIVKKGKIVGEGYHRAAGLPHAEVEAIRSAKGETAGATMYVTLEPCCHHGRTGPCTEAIRTAGIRKVVYATADPDKRVNCRGESCLIEAGIKVERGVLENEALQLNEIYFGYHRLGRPYIILKTAQTLDGRIATRTGDSKWISSPPALKLAHQLRADVDAVVVGLGTVRADDPALTVRNVKGPDPYRIVLSESLRFPRHCRLLDENTDGRSIVATTNDEAVDRLSRRRWEGLILWKIKRRRGGGLDLNDFVVKAGRFGLQSLLVEGGSSVATSFLKTGLVDKYVVVIAPRVIGCGTPAVADLKVARLADGIVFDRHLFKTCGRDAVFVGYPKWERP
ncbi:MAG: bifunctional diaminohydroxyphosphoribosylaminopyrimidine deaminase/5-amino-6-(5-phosphoribosylamino)uracil reductase RibD [bacterium]